MKTRSRQLAKARTYALRRNGQPNARSPCASRVRPRASVSTSGTTSSYSLRILRRQAATTRPRRGEAEYASSAELERPKSRRAENATLTVFSGGLDVTDRGSFIFGESFLADRLRIAFARATQRGRPSPSRRRCPTAPTTTRRSRRGGEAGVRRRVRQSEREQFEAQTFEGVCAPVGALRSTRLE